MRLIPALLVLLTASPAIAVECPTPQPCTVVYLSDNDLTMLMGDKGVLSTAAQARNLDLGGYVTYFAGVLSHAEKGTPKAVEQPKTQDQAPVAKGDKK
jgi:hypothetical protein